VARDRCRLTLHERATSVFRGLCNTDAANLGISSDGKRARAVLSSCCPASPRRGVACPPHFPSWSGSPPLFQLRGAPADRRWRAPARRFL